MANEDTLTVALKGSVKGRYVSTVGYTNYRAF